MKFTEGPWKLIMDEVGGFALVGGDGSRIADIHSTDKNAVLLAHALDMMDMLKAAVPRVEIANLEGDPILSAWATDARKLITAIDNPYSCVGIVGMDNGEAFKKLTDAL